MKQQQNSVATSVLADAVKAPGAGLMLLDPAMQKMVSGGAPKGGWEIDVLETDPAPKGGW